MARLKPGEKRLQLSFQRADDLRLHAFLEKRAFECRWDISTLILASLQDAFRGQIDESEIDAIAEEAARKVRERKAVPEEKPIMDQIIEAVANKQEISVGLVVNDSQPPMSPDDAYEQAVRQIAALNAQPINAVTPKKKKKALTM